MLTRLLLCGSLLLAGCGTAPVQPGAESVHSSAPPDAVQTEADQLLAADREFAATSLAAGAPAAFHRFMDENGMQLPAGGEPVTGRDKVRAALADGPPIILSWEPRYAEILGNGWGWTWGEWQAHEPGAGGRRVGQGKYMNLWRKQPDGSWKVRLDMGNTERKAGS